MNSVTTDPGCAVVCDIDGVLWHGDQRNPIPNAAEAVQLLSDHGIPILYVTNGGGKLESSKAADLSACLLTSVHRDQVVTSHTAMLHHLLETGYKSKHILFVGYDCKSIHAIAQSYGFENYTTLNEYISTHHYLVPWSKRYEPCPAKEKSAQVISAVVMLDEPAHWAEALQVLSDVFQSVDGIIEHNSIKIAGEHEQLPYLAANPDFIYPTGFTLPRYTARAFNVCLSELFSELTGNTLKIDFYGKPLRKTYDYAQSLLTENGSKDIKMIYAIGDNPLSDIKGANEADGINGNWFSILVRTGCWVGKDNDDKNPAKLVVHDVLEAAQYITKKHQKAK